MGPLTINFKPSYKHGQAGLRGKFVRTLTKDGHPIALELESVCPVYVLTSAVASVIEEG